MKLGMVVRDDQGGLGNLTREAWAHLKPEVTCVVMSRPCRGTPNPEYFQRKWTNTFYVNNPIEGNEWRHMAREADVWWTAETWYNNKAEVILRSAERRSVLYAMPELFSGSTADDVWNPTPYLSGNTRLGKVVPWPTTPPPQWKLRTGVRRILHISGGAQYDRNGTETFLECLSGIPLSCEVVLHQPDVANQTPPGKLDKFKKGKISVRVNTDYIRNLKALLDWADVLVLPRRYAGLCLPAYEAFGGGCLVVMPDVAPQTDWPIIGVPAVADGKAAMKGGKIPLWATDVSALAETINRLLESEPRTIVRHSQAGRDWAEQMSWDNQLPIWKQELCE